MRGSIVRTYRIIRGYLSEKTFGKMVFMLFSRTFILFGIGLVTIPALFLFFYDSLAEGDALKVCGGLAVFGLYVVWVIWADKRRMLRYNRLFFESEVRIHKAYIGKMVNLPYGIWQKEYDVGKAVNLIEDGTDEVMMRFRDFVALLFKGAAVALINVWIFLISDVHVVVVINLAIVAEFGFSLWGNRKIAALEKKAFDVESAYNNLQRIFTEHAEDYSMAGLGGYWEEKISGNLDEKYENGRRTVNRSQMLQAGMDFIDLFLYLAMLLYGLADGGDVLSPLVIIMAYEMIKDVTRDFLDSILRIQNKVYAVDEFEKIDALTNRAEEQAGDFTGIRLDGVDVELDGNRILTDVNLSIPPHSKVIIVGDNGSGKTALLKTLLGIYRPARGQVRYGERLLEEIPSGDMARMLAYDPVERMLFPASVGENVNLYADGQGYKAEEIVRGLRELLGTDYDAGEEIDDAGSRFSLGQIDTLCMFRVWASGSPLCLLDEPLAHADKRIFHLIWKRLIESDRTVVAVEHEFDEIAAKYNPCIVWMEQGRIKAVGEYRNLMEQNEDFRRWRRQQRGL